MWLGKVKNHRGQTVVCHGTQAAVNYILSMSYFSGQVLNGTYLTISTIFSSGIHTKSIWGERGDTQLTIRVQLLNCLVLEILGFLNTCLNSPPSHFLSFETWSDVVISGLDF